LKTHGVLKIKVDFKIIAHSSKMNEATIKTLYNKFLKKAYSTLKPLQDARYYNNEVYRRESDAITREMIYIEKGIRKIPLNMDDMLVVNKKYIMESIKSLNRKIDTLQRASAAYT